MPDQQTPDEQPDDSRRSVADKRYTRWKNFFIWVVVIDVFFGPNYALVNWVRYALATVAIVAAIGMIWTAFKEDA